MTNSDVIQGDEQCRDGHYRAKLDLRVETSTAADVDPNDATSLQAQNPTDIGKLRIGRASEEAAVLLCLTMTMNDRAAPWHISNLKLIVGQIQQFLPLGETPQEKRTTILLEKFDTTPDELTVSDIFELDIALHRLLPTQSLLSELPMLRLRYKEAVGERQYAVYRPFDVGATPNFDDPRLRTGLQADCEILLIGLYREYALSPHREGLRRSFAQRNHRRLHKFPATHAVFAIGH